MRILIRGAGDLATGIAWELHRDGHQVVMTDLPVPLAVRREVSLSRSIYEGTAQVEDLLGVRAENILEVREILQQGAIPVLADPQGDIRSEFRPDVLVDAIMAKKNMGTRSTDAPLVIAVGPGFSAGEDCHVVIETVRGPHLGECIFEGSALPDTGIPGEVGGYTIERLIQASADGIMEPVAEIGEIVAEGQLVAYTGGQPVYAKLRGIIRGMLQEGVEVRKGMKIGDVDARCREELARTISDKSHRIGCGVREAISSRSACRNT